MVLKHFDDNPSLYSRALQIWQILISEARNRRTITYEMLADMLGYKGAGALGKRLGPIWAFCKYHNLPPLTVIVVGKDSGEPGEGLEEYKDIGGSFDQTRENVFKYNWFSLYPPSESDFKQAWEEIAGGNG